MRALEQVEKTNPEAEIKKYRNNLLEITHFKAPEYRPRRWKSEEKKMIPLESHETLEDPRLSKCKMPPTSSDTEKSVKKICKPAKEPEPIGCISTPQEEKTKETAEDPSSTIEGIILHITDSELNLFPEKTEDSTDSNLKEDCTNSQDKRNVYLNNNWQVKDLLFQEIIEEDPNIDWLTFISENINY